MEEKVCFARLNELFLKVLDGYEDYINKKKNKTIEIFNSNFKGLIVNIGGEKVNKTYEDFYKIKKMYMKTYNEENRAYCEKVETLINVFWSARECFEFIDKNIGPEIEIELKNENDIDVFWYLFSRAYEEIKKNNNLLRLRAIDFEFDLKKKGFFSRLFS